MAKARGILNRNALNTIQSSLSGSGILRMREPTPDNFILDVNSPTVELQKGQAHVTGAGRLVIANGSYYIPAYTNGIGVAAGSGYTAPSDGIYQADAAVAVSGVTGNAYVGVVMVNSVAASGTECPALSDSRGAAIVQVHGVVHAAKNQVINVGVKALVGNITTIGTEELVVAPAANLRVTKLGSDELSFN